MYIISLPVLFLSRATVNCGEMNVFVHDNTSIICYKIHYLHENQTIALITCQAFGCIKLHSGSLCYRSGYDIKVIVSMIDMTNINGNGIRLDFMGIEVTPTVTN